MLIISTGENVMYSPKQVFQKKKKKKRSLSRKLRFRIPDPIYLIRLKIILSLRTTKGRQLTKPAVKIIQTQRSQPNRFVNDEASLYLARGDQMVSASQKKKKKSTDSTLQNTRITRLLLRPLTGW